VREVRGAELDVTKQQQDEYTASIKKLEEEKYKDANGFNLLCMQK